MERSEAPHEYSSGERRPPTWAEADWATRQAGSGPNRPRSWGLAIGLIIGVLAVAIVVGLVVLGSFLAQLVPKNGVEDLAVGDCFDEPSVTNNVTNVPRLPCSSAHDGEVILVVTDPATGAYPGRNHFQELANERCLPAASSYLGTDFDTRADIDAGYFYPAEESWNGGDRGLTCYLYRVDSAPLSASVRNIGTSPLP